MKFSTVSRLVLSCALCAGAAWISPALAQSAPADEATEGDEIIVTGRAGTTEQKKVDASYAISTISSEELQMRAPIGVVEALKQVPGFFITNTSGEASSGVRVRGIPSDGFQTVALLEDGIAIQADPGLGWLNGDQSLRYDQTVERIEVVRGGPSSIFYSNAPGAAINFISRKGGDTLKGLARYEAADYGSHRVDGWLGGPIGDWRFFVGGYYRLNDGPRNAGFRLGEGGQIRANLSRDFGRGSVTFGIKRIDERITNWGGGIYTTDANGDAIGVPGFDPKRDTIQGPESRYFDFRTPDGTYGFDSGVGSTVKLTQYSFTGDYELADKVKIEQNIRYRESWTRRNSITPYSVSTASALLSGNFGAAAPAGSGRTLGLVYRDSGEHYDLANANGNGLALVNLARSYTTPLSEFISDTRLVASFELAGTHNFAFGGYYANVDEGFETNSAAILTEVADQARVLDAYVYAANGAPLLKLTDNGVAAYGSEWNNAQGTSDTYALYASDEWQITDKLRLDGGVRWERIAIKGEVEGKRRVNLGQSSTVADDSVTTGNGVFTPYKRSFDRTAWTVGANYQFEPWFGAFVRYTDTFRLPNISSFIGNAGADPVIQTMNFIEGGLKFSRRAFDLYLTGFRTKYNSYEISDFRNINGTLTPFRVLGDTRTWGTELEAGWRPTTWFDLHAAWTWQDARFTDFVYTNNAGVLTDYSDHRMNGLPHNSFRVSPAFNLFGSKLRIESDINYSGQRYTDVANEISLKPFWVVDLTASYEVSPNVQLNLIVSNLTNEFGLVNGNPRAGTIDNGEAGQAIFIGSSQFRRSFRGAVTFRF
ncbi:TonB-dependent receptor [Sphingomonas aracearum]|uniref:Cyclic nucleotide-binding protein n=1 Tax=Sphingomonas aracearum TaxID=2283317 RepID=A0A369VX10_9SPHN|nr:TonB-dependent receptor [Sphingomonas aracearum]RDE05700.1 cyclic nucleotide-binding protein [Sphingomonas aracearum]